MSVFSKILGKLGFPNAGTPTESTTAKPFPQAAFTPHPGLPSRQWRRSSSRP
jgi:hypothetical protein